MESNTSYHGICGLITALLVYSCLQFAARFISPTCITTMKSQGNKGHSVLSAGPLGGPAKKKKQIVTTPTTYTQKQFVVMATWEKEHKL